MNFPLSSDSALNRAIKQALDGINAILPKGITATVIWPGHRPALRYTVKFMHEGVRHNLGTFITPEGAIEAMINMKNKKMFTISKAEADARFAAVLETNEASMLAALNKEKSKAEQGAAGPSSLSPTAQSKLYQSKVTEAAFNSLPPTKFDSGKDFEFYWEETGEIVVITPKMVKKFYEDMNSNKNSNKEEGSAEVGELEELEQHGQEDKELEETEKYGTGKKVPTQNIQNAQNIQEDKFNENDW